MKWIIALLTVIGCATLAIQPGSRKKVSAVVPVDPEQDLYGIIRAGKSLPGKPASRPYGKVAEVSRPVVIEGHRHAPRKHRKVFSAARFVCALPIEEARTYTVLLKCAEEAEEAIITMKKNGCDEITLKSQPPGELYDAIVKTARQHDLRVNA